MNIENEITILQKQVKNLMEQKDKSIPLIKFIKTDEHAVMPNKCMEGDLGIDIWSCEQETVVITPCSQYMFKTGIASIIPKGYGLLVADRSSMGSKGIIYAGGVVDGQYRGEIRIILTNIHSEKVKIFSSQDKSFVEKCKYFDPRINQFIDTEPTQEEIEGYKVWSKEVMVVKYLNDAIAQLLFTKNHELKIVEASQKELEQSIIESERKESGFGHSNN